LRPPESYSQHGEDLYVFNTILRGQRESGIYVDIGASHPARLSNTYLLYKKGWRGLIVEPIASLIDLHRQWRPEDVRAQCLIGDRDDMAEFYQLYPSVLSTTSKDELEHRIRTGSVLLRTDILPQLTLSTLLARSLPVHKIDFMSVDVEGVDTMVARQVADLPMKLRPTILCIESNSPVIEQELRAYLEPAYRHQHTLGCNLIFWETK
jgi:hypothetical protein